jgi:hypothetical protein
VGTIERRATCHTVATCADSHRRIVSYAVHRVYIACTSRVHRVSVATCAAIDGSSLTRVHRVYIACTSRVHLVRAADGRRRASRGYGGAS